VARRGDGLKVVRVVVGHRGERVVLYRVRIAGNYRPRALRYIVSAGGERIGYGIPSASQRALLTVTRDASVLHREISARYPTMRAQGDPAPTALSEGSSPAVLDPAKPGPHDVIRRGYNLGDQVFQPSDIGAKVELAAQVHYPADLENGPYPLAVFLHGNHGTCFKRRPNRSDFRWPCRNGWKPIPSMRGYGYIARPLASHGFIVVSISANGVNALGSRLADTAMRQRGELIDEHLRRWKRWSTVGDGPFDGAFVGAVDMTRIGTMGHSRGGEGVVWHKVVDDERPDPFGIDAVLALAPVDFTRMTINEVPFATMLPTCDGDVSDLQGVHFFDDSRYNLPGDPGPKHVVTAFGANHNFFNTVWSPKSHFPGSFDDGEFALCGKRMSENRQVRIGAAYIVGFFRRYLADDLSADSMWTGATTPGFTSKEQVLVDYLAPDTPTHRRDLFRYTEPNDLRQNAQGGIVEPAGLGRYGWCKNTFKSPCFPGGSSRFDIHRPGLSQGILGWDDHDAVLGTRLPEGTRDVSGFDALQFRTVVPPGYSSNRGLRFQDLAVELVDGNGDTARVAASTVGNGALAVPGRNFFGHLIFHQVRFPLERFEDVDLTDIRQVQFLFTRTLEGVIHVTDVAFSSGGAIVPKT
jgi:hypothetical protein